MDRPRLPWDKDGNIIRTVETVETISVPVSLFEVSFVVGSLSLKTEGLTIREALDELARAPLPRRRFAMLSVSFKEKKGRPIVVKPFQLRFLWSKPETREWFAKRLSTTL